jgi:cobalt-zinc-cadmium resistance protein CzcA
MRRLSRRDSKLSPAEEVRHAAYEVARPILFAVAIIIAVYLPIFFLEGLEGRMFRPMAITVCSALFGALVFALTVAPASAAVHFRRRLQERPEGWFERARAAYLRALGTLLRARIATAAAALAVVAVAIASLAFIGTEFMPRLDEGSILIETRKLPGIALSDSVSISTRVEQIVKQFQPVESIVTKIGRPDVATEAMGINQGDVYVILRPREQWAGYESKERLIEAISEKLEQVPGVAFNFTQPMAMRLDEVVSGIKADVAVKIFGEDSRVLEQKAEQALRVLSAIPGAADAQMEIVSGAAELTVEPDRSQLARYGFNVSDVRQVIETAIAGHAVSDMVEGQRRFPIVVRLPESARAGAASLREILVPAPAGELVRLGQIARVEVKRGPESVSRENGQRRIVVQCNVRGRDLGGFVADAQKAMQTVAIPPGYSIDWGGQFENQERATRRLLIVLPASVLIIFGLLFATFNSVPQALLILLNVPFALVGGVAALWLRGLNLNLSASVGFIALFGVAVLNGIVMVSHINGLRADGLPLTKALIDGAGARLRPVLMTALVASLGFVPMALATSAGAEVQRPLATVVIGGLVTSTVLTLLVLPVVYPWFSPREVKAPRRQLVAQ